MSVDGAINLVNNSAKNPNARIYRLGLLARTIKGDDLTPLLFEAINRIDALCEQMPPDVGKIFQRFSDGNVLVGASTSSKNGWFMDKITTTTYHYKGKEPDAGGGGPFKGKGNNASVEI